MLDDPHSAGLPPLPVQPAAAPWPDAKWLAAPATDAVVELLDRATSIDKSVAGLHLAVVVVHQGRLIAERYGEGTTFDTELISWSMAKSITQALVGISSTSSPPLDLNGPAPVPEWTDPSDPRHRISVDDLLRMSSGLEFVEDYVDEGISHCLEMLFGESRGDAGAYAASLPAVAAPGEQFNYSSGTTNIVCRVLAERHGHHDAFGAWANEVLFGSIGMTARLTYDESGTWLGSSFLHATARDYARFGLLYLRDGVWNGTRVLPAGWVDRARTRQSQNAEGVGYGDHWWIWDSRPGVFYAAGYEAQRIVCDPVSDSVIVRLGKTPIDQAPAVDAWIDELIGLLRG